MRNGDKDHLKKLRAELVEKPAVAGIYIFSRKLPGIDHKLLKIDRRDRRKQELMSLLYIMSGNRQERQEKTG